MLNAYFRPEKPDFPYFLDAIIIIRDSISQKIPTWILSSFFNANYLLAETNETNERDFFRNSFGI